MNKFIIGLCIYILYINAFAQNFDARCDNSSNVGYAIEKLIFTSYENNTVIKDKYSGINLVKNATPEELLKSQYSATNNEWLSMNFGKPMEWTKEQFDNLNDKNNYIQLESKIQINLHNVEYAIVKINQINSSKKIPSALLMKNSNGKWTFSEDRLLQNLNFIFMLATPEDLNAIFTNNSKTNNEPLNDLIKHVWSSGKFDYSEFLKQFGELLLQNSQIETRSTSKNVKTEETQIKPIGVVPFLNQEYCAYFYTELSDFNEARLEQLINNIKSKNEGSQVKPLFSFKYNLSENEYYVYLKYEVQKEKEIYQETKVYNNQLKEIEKEDILVELLENNNVEKLEQLFNKRNEYVTF